jgi:hypothetical protein
MSDYNYKKLCDMCNKTVLYHSKFPIIRNYDYGCIYYTEDGNVLELCYPCFKNNYFINIQKN